MTLAEAPPELPAPRPGRLPRCWPTRQERGLALPRDPGGRRARSSAPVHGGANYPHPPRPATASPLLRIPLPDSNRHLPPPVARKTSPDYANFISFPSSFNTVTNHKWPGPSCASSTAEPLPSEQRKIVALVSTATASSATPFPSAPAAPRAKKLHSPQCPPSPRPSVNSNTNECASVRSCRIIGQQTSLTA
jgi:hypothetical protein